MPVSLRHRFCCLCLCSLWLLPAHVGIGQTVSASPAPSPLVQTVSPLSAPAIRTPDERLYEGANTGNIAMMQTALHDGANINAQFGATRKYALMTIVAQRDIKALAFVLRHHPDVNLHDIDGVTVLHIAAGDPGSCVVEADKFGADTAMRSAEVLQYRVMQRLIVAGANVNARNRWKATPLHILADGSRDSVSRLELLARHGAALNARNDDGATALHIVADENSLGLLRVLLRLGANPNIRDEDGRTPLMRVQGGYAVYKALIDGGANVNLHDEEGRTLLIRLFEDAAGSHIVAHHDNSGEFKPEVVYLPEESVVRLLLNKGANVNAHDDNRKTALQWSRELVARCEDAKNKQQAQRLIRLLQNAGAKG